LYREMRREGRRVNNQWCRQFVVELGDFSEILADLMNVDRLRMAVTIALGCLRQEALDAGPDPDDQVPDKVIAELFKKPACLDEATAKKDEEHTQMMKELFGD